MTRDYFALRLQAKATLESFVTHRFQLQLIERLVESQQKSIEELTNSLVTSQRANMSELIASLLITPTASTSPVKIPVWSHDQLLSAFLPNMKWL